MLLTLVFHQLQFIHRLFITFEFHFIEFIIAFFAQISFVKEAANFPQTLIYNLIQDDLQFLLNKYFSLENKTI